MSLKATEQNLKGAPPGLLEPADFFQGYFKCVPGLANSERRCCISHENNNLLFLVPLFFFFKVEQSTDF